jgi:Family of unknown function (DUF6178)
MTDNLEQSIERARELREKRNELLRLPPEQALERILSDPQPAALVHSFPEADFYFLVHDIGPEDSQPILALASDKQWDHIVDLESWSKDRIEATGVTRWLNLLFDADPKRFLRWFLKERLTFIEFYLFHHIEVRVREHDQDPSEFGDDFFTLDGVNYVRFLKLPPVSEGSAIAEEERRQFLMKFLRRLAQDDHLVFQNVLIEASHVLPAEIEEQEYHWRNVRLAEKGFVPFEEAVGIYQPVKPREVASQTPKSIPRSPDAAFSMLPVPAYPLREMTADSHVSRALARIEPGDVLTHIQWEFTNLCNQIIVADHKAVRDREQLRQIVAKACGYISLGLERMKTQGQTEVDPVQAAAALMRYPLIQLFRLGFGAALELKWLAERWLDRCWFAKAGLRLTFWGEEWTGVLGGILLKKPQYYDNYKTGTLYREFGSQEDVAHTEEILRKAQALDELLGTLNIRLDSPTRHGFLTWKNLLLTLWARSWLHLDKETLKPIPLETFKPFFLELLPGDVRPDSAEQRRIPDSMKAEFIDSLTRHTGLKDYEVLEKLGRVFEDLFDEIEAEYGSVAAADLDPRFVQLFLLKQMPLRSSLAPKPGEEG